TDLAYAKIVLFSSSQEEKLASIMLDQPLDSPLTVGEVMTLYGTPSCLHVYPNFVVLHFGSVHVLTDRVYQNFNLDTRVRTIVIGNPVEYMDWPIPSCALTLSDNKHEQNPLRSWQGFASIQRYLNVR